MASEIVEAAAVDAVAVVVDSGALEALNRSEIDVQIATAKRFPRSITAFKREAMEQATSDKRIAGTMGYAKPVDGKQIKGPSVRLAEVCACAWGNLRAGARIIDVGERSITAQGYAFDLEKNTAVQVSVSRSIMTSAKDGQKPRRFGDSMIQTTSQAACAIAYREAVFKVIPKALVLDIYEKSMLVAVGAGKSIEDARNECFKVFMQAHGMKQGEVCDLVGVKGVADIGLEELMVLRGYITAIEDGELSVETLRAEMARNKQSVPKVVRITPEGVVSSTNVKGEDDAHPSSTETTAAAAPPAPPAAAPPEPAAPSASSEAEDEIAKAASLFS